jgi:ubiquinone/menaquinone biosynthesis C-methylase UbiE
MTKFLWRIQSSFYHCLRRNPLSSFILQRENESIRSFLKDLPLKQVLDIGCGRGNSLSVLSDSTASVVAVDNIFEMVRKNIACFPGIKFVTADAQFLPFQKNSFELIFCVGLFEYVKNWSYLLQEIHRVLSPAGYAVITISPPGLLTYLRLFMGHWLFTATEEDFQKILAWSAPFSIRQHKRTLLQHQYLLKKEEVVPAVGMF